MKKILILVGLLSAITLNKPATAQLTDPGTVYFGASLGSVFKLRVEDGQNQLATFLSADDYDFGVSEIMGTPGIDPGTTTISMQASANWQLKINALDFFPTISGTGSIPINNLGVYCEAIGIHQFGTEVFCAYTSDDAALGLANSDVVLIDMLTDNSGNQDENRFVLHWLMGTMQGTMNSASMFTQLSAGIFTEGQYTTTVNLTMTEVP
jgi:hypothetical protein